MHSLIILGSGRSGTSMLAGIFARAGFHLGNHSDYLGKNMSNPKGFFEDFEVNTLNEDILHQNIFNIPEKFRRAIFPSHTFYRARWLARLPENRIIRVNRQIEATIEKLIEKEPFCYKDPRFSYTLPAWQKVFKSINIEVKYLIMYREPNKTARSIVRECKESEALYPLKMDNDIALKIWKQMYLHILKNFKNNENKEKWMFIHFDQLFDDHEIEKIEKFTNTSIDKDFPQMSLSRTSLDSDFTNSLPDEIEKIYRQLNTLSNYK